jgi:CubicO group peptidase (beta-lactamase class C family)
MVVRTFAPQGGWTMTVRLHRQLMLAVLSACVAVPVPGSAQATGSTLAASADSYLREKEAAGWSGAVIIEHRGEVILRAGYGMADRERNVRFTTRTIAQIGSLTKLFTAAAIATLAREGRLAFNDSLGGHVPEVNGAVRTVTLHELLTHSSGLPQDCGRDFERITSAELVSRCLNGVSLETRGRYAYSNLGYSVLGIVAERASGQSLEAYMEARFFRPLGLKTIAYTYPGLPHPTGTAVCYMNGRAQRPIADRIAELDGAFWILKGNGGLQASVDEMYLWYRALRDEKALPRDLVRTLLTPQVPHTTAGVSYGYGWNVRLDSADRVVQASHTGSDGVCWAAIVWRPVDDGFIYVTGNADTRVSGEIASTLLRMMRDQSAGVDQKGRR